MGDWNLFPTCLDCFRLNVVLLFDGSKEDNLRTHLIWRTSQTTEVIDMSGDSMTTCGTPRLAVSCCFGNFWYYSVVFSRIRT